MPTEQAAVVCLDVGSTWTKAALVHPDGALAGFADVDFPVPVPRRGYRPGRAL